MLTLLCSVSRRVFLYRRECLGKINAGGRRRHGARGTESALRRMGSSYLQGPGVISSGRSCVGNSLDQRRRLPPSALEPPVSWLFPPILPVSSRNFTVIPVMRDNTFLFALEATRLALLF